eukprot:3941916-Rhodomonas_salina.2
MRRCAATPADTAATSGSVGVSVSVSLSLFSCVCPCDCVSLCLSCLSLFLCRTASLPLSPYKLYKEQGWILIDFAMADFSLSFLPSLPPSLSADIVPELFSHILHVIDLPVCSPPTDADPFNGD